MASPAFQHELPPGLPYSAFTNGEQIINSSPVLGGESAGSSSTWFSRRLFLPSGQYTLKFLSDDAATVRIGSSLLASRVVAASTWDDGAINTDFFVMSGETRLDVLVHNLNVLSDTCFFVMTISRNGKLVYASNSQHWLFDAAPIADVDLLGDADPLSVTPVFTVLPNWKSGINERLSWLTDVLTSGTGVEQRRSLRAFPRRTFETEFMRRREWRARLDNFIAGIGRKPFYMPLWHEQYRVPNSFGVSTGGVALPADSLLDREFRVGDLVLVTNGDPEDYEVAEIAALDLVTGAITWAAALDRAWPKGTRIMPLRLARMLEDPEQRALTDSVGEVRVRFDLVEPDDLFADPTEYPDTTALSAPSWGHTSPLFQFKPNFATALTFTYERNDTKLDNQVGPVHMTDLSNESRIGQRLTLLLRGRAAVFKYRRFIAKARGRALRFYMPTFTRDLEPIGDLGGTYIECRPAGFARLVQTEQEARFMIGIVMRNGSPTVYRTVTNVLEDDDGAVVIAEQFHLNEALPVIALADVARIEWIVTSRFDQDTFELQHHVDDSAAVTAAVVTRSVNGDGMADINS
jgi:hypothetical protein